ncbi:MAG: hypothetical protein K2X77_27045 [Candidatus Obscuribacterales bacterium]|nr:hypothetical protein [Candidatus Obscuribacterales bacterium]
MNTSRIAFFLLTVALALPQAKAQYAGTLPAETVTSHGADAAPAPIIDRGSIASIAPISPALMPKTARPVATPGSLSSPSPSSLKMVPAASVAVPSLHSSQKRLTKAPLGLKPPKGSKKGHWVEAPIYSMSGMPQWVEDK